MNSHLAAIGPLLAAPWRWRLNQSSRLQLWGGVLVFVGLLGLLTAFKGWLAAALSASLAAAALLVMAWMLMLAGLRRQNHPHLARLVPGHVLRLRLAVLLIWGVPVLCAGAAAVWLAADAWKALLLAGLGLSLLTTFVRWPLSFVLVWFLPPALIPLWQEHALAQALSQAWLAVWQQKPSWLCLPILAGLAVFQTRLIGRGDEAHAHRYRRMQRLLASMQDGAGGLNPRHQGRWGMRMIWLFSALNRWYLQGLIRAPQPTLRHRLARLELVLYGGAHWSMILGSMLVILPFIALGFYLLSLLVPAMSWSEGPWRQMQHNWLLLGVGQLCMGLVIGMMFNLGTALQRSRREQALLVLLPGVPQQGPLRARLLARQGLLMLGLAAPGLVLLNQAELAGPVPWLLAFAVGLLPASLVLLRPWAGQTGPGNGWVLAVAVPFGLAWRHLVHGVLAAQGRLLLIGLLLLLTVLAWAWALRRAGGESLAALPIGRRAE